MKKKRLHKLLQTITALIIVLFIGNSFSNENKDVISAERITNLNLSETSINSVVDTKLLILVNDDYPINMDYKDLMVSAFKEVALSRSNIEMHNITLQAVANLFNVASTVGYADFYITSGYRTYVEQEELYNSSEDKSYVQRPGHSEHQTGLAVDISYGGIGIKNLGSSKQGKWLSENAWKYGLILRYPEDKTEITKISYEPWHFRYIGLPHAYFSYENNLCFEEYLEYLKNTDGYTVSLNETKYTVYYQKAINDIINVPADKKYEISQDNIGGFIVTVKE